MNKKLMSSLSQQRVLLDEQDANCKSNLIPTYGNVLWSGRRVRGSFVLSKDVEWTSVLRAWNCPADILKYTRQMSGVKDPGLDRRLTEQINFSSTRTQTLLTTVSVTNCNCNNHANKWEISGNLPPCCGLSGTAVRCCITCGWWERTSLIALKKKSVNTSELKKTKQKNKTAMQKEASEHRRNWSKLIDYCSFLQHVCRSPICFCVFSPTAWRFQTRCNSCIKSATPPPAVGIQTRRINA